MQSRNFHIRISPENIKNDLFLANFDAGSQPSPEIDPCCIITPTNTLSNFTGYVYSFSSMTNILSGGTNGNSLLSGLTIPILLTENTVDIGVYSPFDGMICQQDVITNFLFTGSPLNPFTIFLTNTSDLEFRKYLSFSNYTLDWGDGTIDILTSTSPSAYNHTYPNIATGYTLTLSGLSPWGYNIIKKQITLPITNTTIPNPNGQAFFTPLGGSWSGTLLNYDYIFSGDAICDVDLQISSNYTPVPFLITGYTYSTINDLQVYGPTNNLYLGRFNIGVQVTGSSGTIGIVSGTTPDGSALIYNISGVTYMDLSDGTTIFMVESSGTTAEMISCSALTKNEFLLNMIEEPEVQSDIFIERGKNSAFERFIRLNEVDNMGDLEKYGYRFFNIINI
jgi:hypothetical protein